MACGLFAQMLYRRSAGRDDQKEVDQRGLAPIVSYAESRLGEFFPEAVAAGHIRCSDGSVWAPSGAGRELARALGPSERANPRRVSTAASQDQDKHAAASRAGSECRGGGSSAGDSCGDKDIDVESRRNCAKGSRERVSGKGARGRGVGRR